MFSSQLPKIHTLPRESLYLGGALLLMVGLLMAIAAVASGQVSKAQLRESLQASQQSAQVNCVETLRGTALSSCMRQARTDGDAPPMLADAGGLALARGVAVAPAAQGFMPVAFSALR